MLHRVGDKVENCFPEGEWKYGNNVNRGMIGTVNYVDPNTVQVSYGNDMKLGSSGTDFHLYKIVEPKLEVGDIVQCKREPNYRGEITGIYPDGSLRIKTRFDLCGVRDRNYDPNSWMQYYGLSESCYYPKHFNRVIGDDGVTSDVPVSVKEIVCDDSTTNMNYSDVFKSTYGTLYGVDASSSGSLSLSSIRNLYNDICDKGHDPLFGETIKNKTKKSMITKLSNYITKTVDADTQALLKAGIINGDLEPTEKGFSILREILFFENRDAIVARAKEIITEEESKKNCRD